MSKFEFTPYTNECLQQIVDLLLEYRLATSVRAYPTLWRLKLLISSRVWDRERDVAVWTIKSGMAMAAGMLWRRRYDDTNIILEYFFDPGLRDSSLLDELIDWSQRRAREIGHDLDQSVRLYAGEHSLMTLEQPNFSRVGFARSEVDRQHYTVFYQRPLTDAIDPIQVPRGFSLKSLSTSSDLDAYDHLYSFTDVNPKFRQELLTCDEYSQLVLADEEDELISFCEYSVSRAEWARGAERLGWIDYVGTHDNHQGQGLGTIVLVSALSNLMNIGAETAILATVSDNHPAIGLYEKTGFTQARINMPSRFFCELQT